jgi:cyclase
MLAKRIIACLDVRDGWVVKGTQFKNHQVVGDIIDLAIRYREEGADELVFYDITASADGRRVSRHWVSDVARVLNIPFCVAGGIRSVDDAAEILAAGADKISINSPAIENPGLITELSKKFGQQCIVIGVDSMQIGDRYEVCCYTGRESTTLQTKKETMSWLREVQSRGAGEIVLNCINRDGTGEGYDLRQLSQARKAVTLPLVASGGARTIEDFERVFQETHVDGALAAGAFHSRKLEIPELKRVLAERKIEIRLCN